MGVDVSFMFQARPDAPLFLAVFRRAARTYALGVGAVFIVIALITAAGFHSYTLAVFYAGIGVAFAVWGPGYMAAQSIRKNAAKIGLLTGYRFDEQGIRIAVGFEEHVIGWSEVAAVEEWAGQFALFVGPRFGTVPGRFMTYQLNRRIVTVPTADLTEQQRTQLRALLQSRGATAVPATD